MRATFERNNALFNCRECGRRARNTTDIHGHQLCSFCDERTMTENGINDGAYPTPEQLAIAEKYIETLRQKAIAKGGVLK
jgi:hypothetical protein